MYIKQFILYLLLIGCSIPVSAQLDNGSYNGFQIIKGKELPDVISINVLSLGNDVSQFSDGQKKKPLQGKYHIIINRNKYYIGNFTKGIPNGDWEEYYYNSLYEKYTYKNGKYDGKAYAYGSKGPENKYPTTYTFKDGVTQHYISYHQNGQVEQEIFYDDKGKIHGEIVVYDKDGNIIQERRYNHGYLNGKQMKFDNSSYKETSEYTNGRMTGLYCRFYPNGNIEKKGTYDENGKKTGKWIHGEENGDIRTEENYLNDKLNGESRTYYKGNVLESIEEYTDNRRNGKCIDYDEDPHVIYREANYVNGTMDGEFKIYYKGILWKSGISKNGITVLEKQYENGKLQILRLLDEDGSLVNVEQYNKAGQKTYKNKNYKQHSSIKLKENASGVIDVEVE